MLFVALLSRPRGDDELRRESLPSESRSSSIGRNVSGRKGEVGALGSYAVDELASSSEINPTWSSTMGYVKSGGGLLLLIPAYGTVRHHECPSIWLMLNRSPGFLFSIPNVFLFCTEYLVFTQFKSC